MKNTLFIAIAFLFLNACTSTENYKTIRQEVMTVHDKVMIDGERAIGNKMKLDTLVLQLDSLKKVHTGMDTLKEKQQINYLRKQLNQVDEQMMDWMHRFDAELGKKSHEEAVAYFKAEKKKINTLDSLYQQALKQSNDYIKQFKK